MILSSIEHFGLPPMIGILAAYPIDGFVRFWTDSRGIVLLISLIIPFGTEFWIQ